MSLVPELGKEGVKKEKVGGKSSKPPQSYWDKKDITIRNGGLFHDASTLLSGAFKTTSSEKELDIGIRLFEKVLDKLIEVRKKYD